MPVIRRQERSLRERLPRLRVWAIEMESTRLSLT
eukprot:COSAG02_NODE_7805_length_2838_cov_9.647682_1_plen_33_part_10